MRRTLVLLLSVAALVLALIAPAGAITDGELDGDGHPHVALMIAKNADGNPMWRCSGTFLSPTVFLTAGHCTDGAATAEIWLDSGPIPWEPEAGYPFYGDVSGDAYTHPEYETDYPWFMRDVGVVVLNGGDAVDLPVYGELPDIDEFDAWKGKAKNGVTFTAVGYGLQKAFPDAAAWKDVAERVRMVSYPKLIQINVKGSVGNFSMLLSNNAHTGGTCFGDSGGPNFVGETNVVGAVTSFGKNPTCAGQGGVLRLDREWINTWVADFLEAEDED